ncbi:AraC family transcriptional regulator [Actinomycetospora cinnamomea]|uniref:AraC family transcriptional regulator n=1 Tax=Actinomycetospora cinnamomea TaxID=663609 RepID=UPI0010576FF6|nr:AraC family transcriptional regulator [Actinomycetospora cinnamomea]
MPRTVATTTTDPEHARAACGEVFFPHRMTVLHDRRDFAMSLDAIDLGPVAAGVLSYGGEVLIETGELATAYEVNVALDGVLRTRSGSVDVCASTHTAAVYRPDGASRLHGWADGGRLFGLKVERRALEAHLAVLLDRPVRGPVALAPTIDLAAPEGRRWWSLVAALAGLASDPRGFATDPRVMRPLLDAVVGGLLHTVGHPEREALARTPTAVGPRSVRRAVEAVAACPEHPWTVAELAAAAGVSARGLQDGFRRHHGTSPMAHVREVRLRRAHDELREHGGGVAAVAARWGFTHLGRFARAHREAFGEAPAVTARRAGTAGTDTADRAPRIDR